MNTEFTITGYFKDSFGIEKQTYILHDVIICPNKQQAIYTFTNNFKPQLELIRILSITDSNGDLIE